MMAPMKRITHELTYPGATVEQVTGMLMTPAFREAVCEAQKDVQKSEVTIDGTTVTVDQTRARTGSPASPRSRRQRDPDPPGGALDLADAWRRHRDHPREARPDRRLGRGGGGRRGITETVTLEITVSIPFVGRRDKIESLIGEKLKHSLETENRVGRTWLEGQA